jgi:hypothetical protein
MSQSISQLSKGEKLSHDKDFRKIEKTGPPETGKKRGQPPVFSGFLD